MEFFATAAKGTEGALRDELRELRLRGVRADRGGVHFAGEIADGMRACLHSRIAVRILATLSSFDAPDADALYAGARAIDWEPYLSPEHTLAVSASCKSSALTHTQFIAQKTKDAIVDSLRERAGARPSVDVRDPDVRVSVHLANNRAQVYLDLSGEALHRRGYRQDTAEAPLKENLAAAILRLAGWDRARPLLDPMCGTGTFGIEAALWARDIAPGIARRRFGFERWKNHGDAEREAFARMRDEAQERVKLECPEILSSDVDERAVSAARVNGRAAGVSANVRVIRRDIVGINATRPPGFVVVNPPYGERLEGDDVLFDEMARAFESLHGHTVTILTGTPAIERHIRPRYRAHTLFNGPIECRLIKYDVR